MPSPMMPLVASRLRRSVSGLYFLQQNHHSRNKDHNYRGDYYENNEETAAYIGSIAGFCGIPNVPLYRTGDLLKYCR